MLRRSKARSYETTTYIRCHSGELLTFYFTKGKNNIHEYVEALYVKYNF